MKKEKYYVPKGRGYKNGDYFITKKDNKLIFLDSNGEIMDYPLIMQHENLILEVLLHYRFKHNFRAISNKDNVGIVDKNGKIVIPYIYKSVTQHQDGNFTATTFDDKEIKINTEDLIKENL